MSWINPKTSWSKSDYINASDYNRIKNNVEFIKELIQDEYDFPYEDMGEDKSVNDYWYADEVNTICDNLDSMCEALGGDFSGKPMYSDNGATPTYAELNLIEKRTRDLYNQIMGTYTLYLGIGYTGNRISNILL